MAMLALIVPLGVDRWPVDPGFGVPAPPSGGGGGAPVYRTPPIYYPSYPSHQPLPPMAGRWTSGSGVRCRPPVDPGYGRPAWGAGHPSHPIAGVPPMYPSGQPVPPGWAIGLSILAMAFRSRRSYPASGRPSRRIRAAEAKAAAVKSRTPLAAGSFCSGIRCTASSLVPVGGLPPLSRQRREARSGLAAHGRAEELLKGRYSEPRGMASVRLGRSVPRGPDPVDRVRLRRNRALIYGALFIAGFFLTIWFGRRR